VYTLMREIELKPSRLLGLLLFGMVLLSLASISLAAIPGGVQLAWGTAVIGFAAWGRWKTRFTESLRISVDGQLQSRDERGEWRDVEVSGDSLVSPAFTVLRYRTLENRVRTHVLLADSAEPDHLRCLRVSLRWTRHKRSGTGFPDAG
jgi:toxin CptA